ncbi:histidine phosphatase family protein [Pseudotenacibaculum sp. MALMAid0570]|uniref:histidine phosphatase family protein n=1 Tax=Pseudotenacibaculum sp. MALMAid0570 TaxID=3143938 RepID=UPI0032E0079F
MKKVLFILAFALFSLASYAQEVTTYYFIRHAEKQRTNPKDRNPSLTFDGYKRADNWKEVFKYIPLDAVYSTDYNRTKLTAKPTADSKKLPILVYNPRNMYSEGFQNNTKGKRVLVVGHSNTTPAFVNKILGKNKYKQIDDSNNSNLYIVTVIDGKVSDTVLKIN